MKLTFEKFSVAPVKVRTLYIKRLLNKLGYNVPVNVQIDKLYKKALKRFQIENGFIGNCVITEDVFSNLISQVENHNEIWSNLNRGETYD